MACFLFHLKGTKLRCCKYVEIFSLNLLFHSFKPDFHLSYYSVQSQEVLQFNKVFSDICKLYLNKFCMRTYKLIALHQVYPTSFLQFASLRCFLHETRVGVHNKNHLEKMKTFLFYSFTFSQPFLHSSFTQIVYYLNNSWFSFWYH